MDDGTERLAAGLISGQLDEEGLRRVSDALERDLPLARELARQLVVHGGLVALGGRACDADAVMASLPARPGTIARPVMAYVRGEARSPGDRRAPRARWIALAAGAAGLAAAAALVLVLRPAPPVRLVEEAPVAAPEDPRPAPRRSPPALLPAAGPARLPAVTVRAASGRPVRFGADGVWPVATGAALRPGEGLLAAGAHDSAVLELGGAGSLTVGPETAVTAVADRDPHLFVARGAVSLEPAAAGGGPLRLTTPHGLVSADGARLALRVDAERTRIAVSSGRARFERADGKEIEVTAGQRAQAVTESAALLRRVLFVVGADPPAAPDRKVAQRLEQRDLDVVTVTPAAAELAQARGSDLIVVSSTISPREVPAWFKALPVPMLVWEPGLYPGLGMTGPCEEHCAFGPGRIPLRFGAGPIPPPAGGKLDLGFSAITWGAPAPTAASMIAWRDRPERSLLFAYERGAAMVSGTAPARRLGFFFGTNAPLGATEEVWKLFDAAVEWCLGGSP